MNLLFLFNCNVFFAFGPSLFCFALLFHQLSWNSCYLFIAENIHWQPNTAYKNAERETIESKHEMLTKKCTTHILHSTLQFGITFKFSSGTWTHTHTQRTYVCNLISVFLPAFICCWLLLFNIEKFEHTRESEKKPEKHLTNRLINVLCTLYNIYLLRTLFLFIRIHVYELIYIW